MSILAGSGFGISKDVYRNHAGMNKAELLSDAVKAIEGLTSPKAEQFLSSEGRAFFGQDRPAEILVQTVGGPGCDQLHHGHERPASELGGVRHDEQVERDDRRVRQ